MTRPVKRALIIVGVLLLVAVAALGYGVADMFAGLRPVEDGREIAGVRIIVDGFSSMGVVPAGPDTVVLIDAGQDQTGAAILAELNRRGLGPSAVKSVLITHGHGDHIGGIRALPNTQVMSLAAEVPVAEGRESVRSPMGQVMPLSPTGITVTRRLADGETLTIGDASIRVFAMPGHTAGSAAYLVNGVLFLGDSAQVTTAGDLRPAPWLVTDDQAQNRASLVRLARRLATDNTVVTALVPAHSGPVAGLGPLAAFAQARP
jgi:hydroxyacylglutathione hydrolase